MVTDVSPAILREHPPELVRYATDEAVRDADEVIAFLKGVGLAPSPGGTAALPPGVLLDLGAVVRLRRWEAAGVSIHRDAGLPSAHGSLELVIRTLVTAAANPPAIKVAGALARSVFDLTVTRFAWAAQPDLGADIALDITDEDALVEAVAQYLWTHRHDTSPVKKEAAP